LEADTAILQLTKMPISCTDCDITQLRRMSVYQLRMAIEQYAPNLNTMPYTFEPNTTDDPLGCFEMWLSKQASTITADIVKAELHSKLLVALQYVGLLATSEGHSLLSKFWWCKV